MKKSISDLSIIGAIVIVAVLGLVHFAFFRHPTAPSASGPPEHGTEFVIEADFSQAPDGTNAMIDLQGALKKRFANVGFKVFLEPISASRLRLRAPVVDAPKQEAVRNFISRGGDLEFRLVMDEGDPIINHQAPLPPGYEVLEHQTSRLEGDKRVNYTESLVVKKRPEPGLTGSIVRNAMAVRDNLGNPLVEFRLKEEGTASFARVTRDNLGRRLAIVLDGKLYSAPAIQGPIESGFGQISGLASAEEAMMLANLLSFPLPVPVTVVESTSF